MRSTSDETEREGATHRVTVKIFGEEYVLRGDAKPAYMERLADMVDRRMNEIA
ncbi:MAG TPA: cell division protein ZapA, partial [Thermaerobacter sp.]